MTSPSPSIITPTTTTTTHRTPALSPAALKLLTNSRSGLMGSDSQLRASYKSPQLFPSASHSTPRKSGFRPTPSPFDFPTANAHMTPFTPTPSATPTP